MEETNALEVVETPRLKLDYSIEDPQERNELVKKIIDNADPDTLTPGYLEILSNYLVYAMTKEERKSKMILTENRMVTINKRESSFQGLVDSLGRTKDGEISSTAEDSLYNMVANDKDILLTPKISITQEDIEEVPGLKDLRKAIDQVEAECKAARGKRKYELKKQVIAMRQDQYVLKSTYKPSLPYMRGTRSITKLNLDEKITIDAAGEPHSNCIISLFNPDHILALLRNYSNLKEDCWDNFESDLHFVMEDLDNLIEETLKDEYPYYYDLLIYKIDGLSMADIQNRLKDKYGYVNSIEYLSILWCNKIPKLLAEQAKEDYVVWYYTYKERGKWKKCPKCGQVKLAHPRFFSKNTTKDGFYSICRECRRIKNKKGSDKLNGQS